MAGLDPAIHVLAQSKKGVYARRESKPPIRAPGIEPTPPRMAATSALRPRPVAAA